MDYVKLEKSCKHALRYAENVISMAQTQDKLSNLEVVKSC